MAKQIRSLEISVRVGETQNLGLEEGVRIIFFCGNRHKGIAAVIISYEWDNTNPVKSTPIVILETNSEIPDGFEHVVSTHPLYADSISSLHLYMKR